MTAANALRAASNTLDCLGSVATMGLKRRNGCRVRYSRRTAFDYITATHDRLESHHWQVASALLDGFSVEEITAVGG
jgi:hypothetical protein